LGKATRNDTTGFDGGGPRLAVEQGRHPEFAAADPFADLGERQLLPFLGVQQDFGGPANLHDRSFDKVGATIARNSPISLVGGTGLEPATLAL
jgi:hypothetical protein